jgi:hypothetical protein
VRQNRLLRILPFNFLLLLILPLISYAQDQGGLPLLYMGSSATIWRVDTTSMGVQEVFSLRGQALVSSSKLSDVEQAFLVALNLDPRFDTSTLFHRIVGLWSLSNGRMIFEVNYESCGMAADHRPCAGYSQFVLMDNDYTTRVLTSIDYHYSPAFDTWTCFWGDPQVTDVIVNPVYDQAMIVLRMPHFNCDRSNSWGILVDFSGDEVSLTDFPLDYGFAWSPDGNHLAYLDLSACLNAMDVRFCSGELRVRDVDGLREVTIPAQVNDHPAFSYDLVTWADENTLVYQQHVFDTNFGDPAELYQLIWYDITSGETTINNLNYFSRFIGLYRLSSNDGVLVGITQDGEIVGFALDSPYTVSNRLTGFRLAYFMDNPANHDYLPVVEVSATNLLPGRDTYLLSTDFQPYQIPIPEVLGDTWIGYITVVR